MKLWHQPAGQQGSFILSNGTVRSSDVSWVKRTRLAALTPKQKQCFLLLYPDFVIELRSPGDSLKMLQDKMQKYIENGASLGWLIDSEIRQVLVFQPQKAMSNWDNPEFLLDESVLTGFKLNMKKIWNVTF